jgi:hypothetical protein
LLSRMTYLVTCVPLSCQVFNCSYSIMYLALKWNIYAETCRPKQQTPICRKYCYVYRESDLCSRMQQCTRRICSILKNILAYQEWFCWLGTAAIFPTTGPTYVPWFEEVNGGLCDRLAVCLSSHLSVYPPEMGRLLRLMRSPCSPYVKPSVCVSTRTG